MGDVTRRDVGTFTIFDSFNQNFEQSKILKQFAAKIDKDAIVLEERESGMLSCN